MHSGTVFWGTKEELRRIMAIVEQSDAQVQMFEREEGDWALHVNFAGAEVSRLILENIRLETELAEARKDVASCGVCKLGDRTIFINDDCPDHGETDQETW